jgi:hypothetical protein
LNPVYTGERGASGAARPARDHRMPAIVLAIATIDHLTRQLVTISERSAPTVVSFRSHS